MRSVDQEVEGVSSCGPIPAAPRASDDGILGSRLPRHLWRLWLDVEAWNQLRGVGWGRCGEDGLVRVFPRCCGQPGVTFPRQGQ